MSVNDRVTSIFRAVTPDADRPGRPLAATEALAGASWLDPAVNGMRRAVRSVPLGAKGWDLLHGRWLGHPAHPLLVQVPIGSWLSASVLDTMPGQRRGATALTALGLAAAAPAMATGWADWSRLLSPQMRVGLVHAAANAVGTGLEAASLVARLRGRHWLGRGLGLAGLTAVGLGGALGGHLAYRQAAGANHAEHVPHVTGSGWHGLGAVADLPVGKPVRRHAGDTPVVVVREAGGEVHVLADTCSHMAGPLSDGEVADGCVRCPWHGSVFRLSDGWNVRGPATSPQPSFESRVVGGQVEARLRGPEHAGAEAVREARGRAAVRAD